MSGSQHSQTNKEVSHCGNQLRQQAERQTVDLGTEGSPSGETIEWRPSTQKKRRCKIYLVDCWVRKKKKKKSLSLPGGKFGSEKFQETSAQRTLQTKSQFHRSQWLTSQAQEPWSVSRLWIQVQEYHSRKNKLSSGKVSPGGATRERGLLTVNPSTGPTIREAVLGTGVPFGGLIREHRLRRGPWSRSFIIPPAVDIYIYIQPVILVLTV